MIFAIESSCDESAIALFDGNRGLSIELVNTQVALHGAYGGVVPDLASREHLKNFPALLKMLPPDFSPEKIGAIAVTRGPGLAGCLALGIALAKALALAWNKPLIGVNHLRGHLFSPFIPLHKSAPSAFKNNFEKHLPHLGLVVSGGNTLLVKLDKNGTVKILAQTVDDAAGEAFDKGAKLLGMPYPGGALIEKNATAGNDTAFNFPRGIPEKNDPRFSFSGLKTSLRYALEKMNDTALSSALPDICASYQAAIIAQLIAKTKTQLLREKFASVGLSGGVANNKKLRAAFSNLAEKQKVPLLIADPRHSGDNAGMIAFAAFADAALPAPKFAQWHLPFAPSLTIEEP